MAQTPPKTVLFLKDQVILNKIINNGCQRCYFQDKTILENFGCEALYKLACSKLTNFKDDSPSWGINERAGMFWEHRKFHAADKIGQKMSAQNLQNLSDNGNMPYEKPITFANYHVHRHHKKNAISQISNFDRLKQTQPKGLVFVWPQRRKFYYVKELSFLTWFIAHALFWLHVMNIFPNGSGMGLSQPPWKYKPPLPKPQNRDYIIEPDWDSSYD